MQNGDESKYKYVFVCGLQRSGTSILGRNIARVKECTGFQNTEVLEDQGRFLQDVYPSEVQFDKDAKLMAQSAITYFWKTMPEAVEVDQMGES